MERTNAEEYLLATLFSLKPLREGCDRKPAVLLRVRNIARSKCTQELWGLLHADRLEPASEERALTLDFEKGANGWNKCFDIHIDDCFIMR